MSSPVSLVVLARNEEPLIRRCVESAAPFVHEVVLLDNASSDRTVPEAFAVVQHFGLEWQLLRESLVHGYPEPYRQRAYDAARGEWVLCMDGDEWITPAGAAQLPSLLASPVQAWLLAVETTVTGAHGHEKADNEGVVRFAEFHLRLWRRGCVLPHPGLIHTDIEARPGVLVARTCEPGDYHPVLRQERSLADQQRRDAGRPNTGAGGPAVWDGGGERCNGI